MNKVIRFYINKLSSCSRTQWQDVFSQSAKEAVIELTVVTSGYIVRDCNFNKIRITSGDIHLSLSTKPSFIEEFSPDAEGWYCCFPSSFLGSVAAHEHLSNEIELIASFLYQYPLRLSEPILERLSSLFSFIDNLFHRPRPDFFLIYIYLLASIYEMKKVIQESHLDFYPAKAFTIAKKYTDLLNQHSDSEHRIEFYSGKIQISPNHLNKSVKAVTGKTAIALLNEARLDEARRRLKETSLPINEIAYQLGFEDPSYFSRFFKKGTGISPLEYREID